MDKKDYYSAYFNKLSGRLEQIENPGTYALRNRELLCKYVWVCVKVLGRFKANECKTREEIEINLKFFFSLKYILSFLTPEELERTFPIEKKYDGEKYQIKDYFFTKNRLKEFEADKPIDESGNIDELLFDYQNMDINLFVAAEMSCIDTVRRLEGLPSMAEEFFSDMGLNTYHKYTDENTGKEFMIDKNGKTVPLEKPRPHNLKVIQGGKR